MLANRLSNRKKMNSKSCLWKGMILFGIAVSQAVAGIAVMPNIINFTKDDLPRKDVIVINEGKEEAYIKITPHSIIAPGTDSERRIIIRNPEKDGLLATPAQLIIPPGQRRLVRLMLTKPLNQQERIYGIDIVPIAKELIPTNHVQEGSKNMGLQLLVGYGVLAMVRSIHPELNIQVKREGKLLIVKNKGNANVELSNFKQCMGKTCHIIKNFSRLYAGNRSQIALRFEAPVTLEAQLLGEQKILTSN